MSATMLCIDLTDAEGHDLGRTVPVVVEYALIPYVYGEDADGNGGEVRYEREVLDVYIDHGDLKALTSEQVGQVVAEAREQFVARRMV